MFFLEKHTLIQHLYKVKKIFAYYHPDFTLLYGIWDSVLCSCLKKAIFLKSPLKFLDYICFRNLIFLFVHSILTSSSFKHVIDFSQQHRHVTQLRLPGLTEHLQIFFCNLARWMQCQCFYSRNYLDREQNICYWKTSW